MSSTTNVQSHQAVLAKEERISKNSYLIMLQSFFLATVNFYEKFKQ